jgi:hypothetical protein
MEARCKSCGVSILETTARETGGTCVPCHRGTRNVIEAARQQRIAAKAAIEADPVTHLRRALVDRRRKGLTAEFTDAERTFLLVSDLIEERFSLGGFFESPSGELYREVLQALISIGALDSAQHLKAGKLFYFGDAEIPQDVTLRRQKMRDFLIPGTNPLEFDAEGSRIEGEFWDNRPMLSNNLAGFAKRSALLPANDVDEPTQN